MVEKVGNRIHLKSEFKHKDIAKSVIGARWAPKDRVWTYPLDLETCRRLRDAFGPDLAIGQELWAWAAMQKHNEDRLTELVNVHDPEVMASVDLPRVRTLAPKMWAAMGNRPYQPVASRYMADARRCLNGDQPGIGKTIETLGALIEAEVSGPVLILAPKTSCSVVWEPEIHQWMEGYPYTVTQLAGLTPAAREEAWAEYEACLTHVDPPETIHFLIANAEQVGIKKFTECPSGICDGDEDWCPDLALHVNKSEKRRPMLHSVKWEAVIADETHKWLINTRGKSASQVGYGFTRLPIADDRSPMYALSGTPLKGKKWNLFGTLNWLWPKTYTSKWRWIESYFEVLNETKDIGRRGTIEVKTITGRWKEGSTEAFFRSLNTVMIRRTKDELRKINPAWMPPEKRYHDVWVPIEGTQKSHYKQMEKGAAAILGNDRLTATGVLAIMTRLKQFANSDGAMVDGVFKPTLPSAKFNWLLQFLEERGIETADKVGVAGDLSDDVRKVVIASQFTTLVNLWAQALRDKGIRCLVLTGETTDAKRKAYVEQFQSDDQVRVFLINTTAGGVSITLDAADDMVIMDETWVPDEQEQVEDRVHRASNVKHQVDIWYVRSKGTIEEDIAKTNATKAESNHIVLDAKRGLRFAQEKYGTVIIKEDK
jgi:SNF2 family DNA or RNA helicase